MNSCSLHRLATSDLIDLSLSAGAQQAQRGSTTRLARKYGVRRHAVVRAGQAAIEALHEVLGRAARGHHVLADHAHMLRCIVALYMVGRCSIWGIVDLLPILFPGVPGGSFGSVQRALVEAAGRAEAFNTHVDLSGIDSAALDEMFSQGDPVLAGIDLDSGFVFALDKRQRRTTEDWRQVLAAGKRQGLDLSTVVRDGGASINSGVRSVFADAEQRDDVLHAMMALTKVLRTVEHRAYSSIRRVDTLSGETWQSWPRPPQRSCASTSSAPTCETPKPAVSS